MGEIERARERETDRQTDCEFQDPGFINSDSVVVKLGAA